MSWSILALMLYTLVQVAKPQELFSTLDSLRLGLVGAVLIVAAACAEGRVRNLRVILQSKQTRCVLALLLFAAISVPAGVWVGGSLDYLLSGYLKVVFYFVALLVIVRSPADLRRMAWAFVLSSVILGLAAWLSYSAGIIEGSQLKGKGGLKVEDGVERVEVTGTYSANELALVLVCAMPFAAVLFRDWGMSGRVLQFVSQGFLAVVVVWTGSRTGFIVLTIVGLLVVIRSTRVGTGGAVLGVLVVAVLVLSVASSAYWDRLGSAFNPTTHYEETFSGRVDIWKRGFSLIIARPLFGVGIGNFGMADEMINQQRAGRSAHNSFIEIWAELGVGGLVICCLLLWTSVKRVRRVALLHPNRWVGECAVATEISLVGLIIGGLANSMQYSPVLYFLVAMTVLAARIAGPGRNG